MHAKPRIANRSDCEFSGSTRPDVIRVTHLFRRLYLLGNICEGARCTSPAQVTRKVFETIRPRSSLRSRISCVALAAWLVVLCAPLLPAGSAAAAGTESAILIPDPAAGVAMHATLFRPPGKGPFPLALINHGSEEDEWGRATMDMPSFPGVTDFLLAHGYAVVVPLRPGHGATGGPYLETQGSCRNADFVKAANATADSIAVAIDYMTKQPFIRPRGVLVVGNSAGAWGGVALAGRNLASVAAIVGFAPGRGGHEYNRPGNNCAPDRLVAAAGAFGSTARTPALWLYAANDTYFPPDLSRRMADAYRNAGGKLDYELLPPVGREGHGLILADGAATWAPYLEKFLAATPARH
jgi:dienelactone hydrolase